MEKFVSLLLVFVMLLSLCSCTLNNTQDINPSASTTQSTISNTEKTTEGTTAATPAPTEATTTASTEASNIAPTEEPATNPLEAPTAPPVFAPTTTSSVVPTTLPTTVPTTLPTAVPTTLPTAAPTTPPTAAPTTLPTAAPTTLPTAAPTTLPTAAPNTCNHIFKEATCFTPKACTKCGITEGNPAHNYSNDICVFCKLPNKQQGPSQSDLGAGEDAGLGSYLYLADISHTLCIDVGAITYTGTINTGRTNGRYIRPFPVKSGEVYHVWGSYNSSFCLIALYDENLVCIGIVGASSDVTIKCVENVIFTVPDTITDANGNPRTVAYIGCSTARYAEEQAVGAMPLKVKKEIIKYNTAADLGSNTGGGTATEIFSSPDGTKWVNATSKDGTTIPIKLRAKAGEVNTAITLPDSLATGTYTLKYEDQNGILPNYLDICSLKISAADTAVSYSGLIAENCAPEGATAIGIYDASGNRVAGIDLGFLENMYSGKLYSFGAISDVHIGQADSTEDFTNAVNYFNANNDIDFVAICGDLVDNGSNKNQLETYHSIASTAKKPIRVAMGNHEALNYASGENFDSIKSYFAQDSFPGINDRLYYSFEHNGDVFIMLGIHGPYTTNHTFSDAQLQWLYETLEKNRNRRCFLFMHYFPLDGSGDAVDCYSSNGLAGSKGDVFLLLLKHYKNVIWFHGHSHATFQTQELNAMNTIDSIYGRYSVHIPSLTWPSHPNSAVNAYLKQPAAGEGYVIDVYEHGIALRGRDFENSAFLPIGSYYLDTVIEEIPANSFCDKTGTLSTPIF